MDRINIEFSYNIIFAILSLVGSAIIAIIFYKHTVPQIPIKARMLLSALRASALFLLLLILGEPVILLISSNEELPITAVLIDNSKSMTISDNNGSRKNELLSVLNSSEFKTIANNSVCNYLIFDENVKSVNEFNVDSLTLQGETTNIANAFKYIKDKYYDKNLQAIILLSDGIVTSGANPIYNAEDLNKPIYTIAIGDTSEQKDLLIRKVLTNEISFVDAKLPVNVTIHNNGYNGKKILASLFYESKKIDEQIIELNDNESDNVVKLIATPKNVGVNKFEVKISQLPEESNYKNNNAIFFVKAIKNKLKISIISSAPSPDVSFIRRALHQNENNDVQLFLENKNGFFENNIKDVIKSDCIIMIGYPSINSSEENINKVMEAINANVPIFTMFSRNMDYNKFKKFNSALGFDLINTIKIEKQAMIEVAVENQNHAIFKNNEEILPPIFKLQYILNIKPEAKVLANVKQQNDINEPLIIIKNINKQKSVSMMGYGLWRLNLLNTKETTYPLDNFVNNVVRWLTINNDDSNIMVRPQKNIFSAQDVVEFTAKIYDENFQPIDNAIVDVKIFGISQVYTLMLNSQGNGYYQGVLSAMPEGDYKYSAVVKINDNTIGKSDGHFSVGGLNAEYIDTRMNKFLMQQIAVLTGGKYYPVQNYSTMPNDILQLDSFKPQTVQKEKQVVLWNAKWLLALIIILFSFEWFLRKRYGLL